MTQIASSLAVATVFIGIWTPFYSEGGLYARQNYLPYSREYWRELNLAVEPKITIARILADFNLGVIIIIDCQTTKFSGCMQELELKMQGWAYA